MRESSDLSSGSMFVSDKKWNVGSKRYSCTVHRNLSVEALRFLIKLGGILRKMMGSYGTT